MTEDQGDRSSRTATARAEELVDRLGERVGYLASLAGWRILRTTALAREEAEDIWAEAQSVRRMQRAHRQERNAKPAGVAETVEATDVARRMAEELNVNLREVSGTGVNGRITASDVKRKKKESTRSGPG